MDESMQMKVFIMWVRLVACDARYNHDIDGITQSSPFDMSSTCPEHHFPTPNPFQKPSSLSFSTASPTATLRRCYSSPPALSMTTSGKIAPHPPSTALAPCDGACSGPCRFVVLRGKLDLPFPARSSVSDVADGELVSVQVAYQRSTGCFHTEEVDERDEGGIYYRPDLRRISWGSGDSRHSRSHSFPRRGARPASWSDLPSSSCPGCY